MNAPMQAGERETPLLRAAWLAPLAACMMRNCLFSPGRSQ
jgi:hypothetical protein